MADPFLTVQPVNLPLRLSCIVLVLNFYLSANLIDRLFIQHLMINLTYHLLIKTLQTQFPQFILTFLKFGICCF